MASIRRTLSPVPPPGTLLSGDAISVASPLSKCSSCNQSCPPSGGSLSSSFPSMDYAFYRVQAFVLSLFSKRSSRPLERSKLKGHVWRRALFHFFICFLVGLFVGLTPFVSIKLSTNLLSKHQAFSFEQVGTVQLYDGMPRNLTTVNATLETHVVNGKQENELSNGTIFPDIQDLNMVFHKFLIIVTPTYPRPFQSYYLNRLAHTLKLVQPPLLWIVVEMSSQSWTTAELLRRSGVMYRHLVCTKNTSEIIDRRVHQRNVALLHIETHRLDGIVYFADDANMYSAELFEQMRQIRRFGTWPIAKLKHSMNEAVLAGPICNGTRVIGWHTDDLMRRFRRFHAELSGFAFNSTILWDTKKWHRPTLEPIRQFDTVNEGFQVSTFIEQVVEDETEMEGMTEDCSKVLVWDLHIESSYSYPWEWSMKNNLNVIVPLSSKI